MDDPLKYRFLRKVMNFKILVNKLIRCDNIEFCIQFWRDRCSINIKLNDSYGILPESVFERCSSPAKVSKGNVISYFTVMR